VRRHFNSLRSQLSAQEQTALGVINEHVAEKLTGLNELFTSVAQLAQQLRAACVQLDATARASDAMLVENGDDIERAVLAATRAAADMHVGVNARLHTSTSPARALPLMFTRDNRVHIGASVDVRVLMLGLDNAGKTSILARMRTMCAASPPSANGGAQSPAQATATTGNAEVRAQRYTTGTHTVDDRSQLLNQLYQLSASTLKRSNTTRSN
jgi:tripartite motif-containing protein 23